MLLSAIVGLGASAVITQLVLLRELLGAFAGNELVVGVALGSWLLLTGAGAWLGGCLRRERFSLRFLSAGLLGIALLPLGQLLAVRGLRDVVFLRGATVDPTGILLGTLALQLPFCLISGALLALASARSADPAERAPGLARVYVADTLGGIAGGALFTFVLVPRYDHFALLAFPAALHLLLVGALAWRARAWFLLGIAGAVTLGLGALLMRVDVDARSTGWQHAGRQIVHRVNSPYARLVVTRDAGQLTFFENGAPMFSTPQREAVEETVHYALSQRPAARRVLLLSGGLTGAAREILRYPQVERVVVVELDPALLSAGRQLLPDEFADARIAALATDGRRFVQTTAERFDVVIVAVPDPATLQLNRYFTAEFFSEAKRCLAPGGVLAFGLGRYANYVSPELAQLLATAHRTVRDSFAEVRLIPGGRVYFLASDAPLTLDIATQLEASGIVTRYVNRHYLAATLAPDRLADLDRALAQPAARNADFAPTLCHYHLRHWLSQFTLPGGIAGGVGLLLLAVYLGRMRTAARVVFAAGFAASTLELVLLLAFQALYGSLYRQVGLVVTVFMAGLAVGAIVGNRQSGNGRALTLNALALAALAAALPIVLPHLGSLDIALGTSVSGQGVLLALTFALAGLVGAQFPLAGASAGATAAQLFTADLVGAALGALLVGAWLLPLFGVGLVCALTAGLNLVAAILVWRSSPRA